MLCMVLIYRILCALYESVFIPFAVLLSVPLRTDGQLPVRVAVRAGEQHLYADWTDHDYRTVCQDRHPADRICRQAAVGRHDSVTGGIQRQRFVCVPSWMVLSMVFGFIPLMMAHGIGCQRQPLARHRRNRWHDSGHIGVAVLVPSLFITFQYIKNRLKRK